LFWSLTWLQIFFFVVREVKSSSESCLLVLDSLSSFAFFIVNAFFVIFNPDNTPQLATRSAPLSCCSCAPYNVQELYQLKPAMFDMTAAVGKPVKNSFELTRHGVAELCRDKAYEAASNMQEALVSV
jgi:hypothetical protein